MQEQIATRNFMKIPVFINIPLIVKLMYNIHIKN